METRRWLLPFTHGVDMRAIDSVTGLAESGGATLVAVSLISVPDKSGSRGARLEHIQQSKDFLEAVKWKVARYEIPVERYEVFTADVMQSITTLTHDLNCDSIVLATNGEKALLLQEHEIKRLLTLPPAPLVLIRLPARAKRHPLLHLRDRFRSRLRWEPGRQQEDGNQGLGQEWDTPTAREYSWSRAEEPRQG